MLNDFFILTAALLAVAKGATLATHHASAVADKFSLSKYTVGFIVIAIISILPETFIAINSSLAGSPAFGLGTLFGSNIADLTLVFAVIVFLARRSIRVEGKVLRMRPIYPFMLLMPLLLGVNGHYSRMEGLALIIAGCIFYYFSLKSGLENAVKPEHSRLAVTKNALLLLSSMALLLVGSAFTVSAGTSLATHLGLNPIIIGMLVVGLGTTMPELFFCLKAVKQNDDSLAVGDILGTVLADATIVVGILALINPFSFPVYVVYVTGGFMVVASLLILWFLKTGLALTRREAFLLIAYWLVFVTAEIIATI